MSDPFDDDDLVTYADEDSGGGQSFPRPNWMVLAIGAVVILGVVYWTRPWWHTFLFGVVFVQPAILWGAGLAGLFWAGSRVAEHYELGGDLPWAQAGSLLAITFLVLGFLVFPILGDLYEGAALAERTDARSEEIASLPAVDASAPRILPQSVGTQFASNSLQLPRHTLADADIAFVDGSPVWSFALQPDGAVNTYVTQQAGAAFVDMTTTEKKIDIVERPMACGPGMQITDSLDWVLHKERFFVEYEDAFYVQHEGELYGAVPMVTYEHKWRFPTFYSVPVYAGVAVVNEACEITILDPEEAQAHPVLEGQPLYPASLARQEVNSMRFVNGILNKLFTHEGELELAPVPGEGNDQPFLMVTENGLDYVLAAEPFGRAEGVFQVWLLDARTGEASVLKLDPASSLLGPSKAAQFLRKDNPRVDWSRMTVSEPLPAVIDDALYWHVKAVPRDSAGVAFTAFVNADTGNVTETRTVQDVVRFLRGEPVNTTLPEAPVDPGQPTPPSPVPSTQPIRLQLADRNGTIVIDQRLEPGWTLELTEGNRTLLVLTAPEGSS